MALKVLPDIVLDISPRIHFFPFFILFQLLYFPYCSLNMPNIHLSSAFTPLSLYGIQRHTWLASSVHSGPRSKLLCQSASLDIIPQTAHTHVHTLLCTLFYFEALITNQRYIFTYFYCPSSPYWKYKVHESRYYLFCSLLYLQHHRWTPTTIGLLNPST